MKIFSSLFLPLFLLLISFIMMLSKRDVINDFTEGSRQGIRTCVELLPTFILLICGINMFNASGAADCLSGLLAPLLDKLGVPAELSHLLIVRPISGGASNAVIESILSEQGPDSFVGRTASVIAGSSDTVIYITAMYFSSIKMKKTGYTLPVCFVVMLFCTVFSCLICRIFFL